MPPYNIRLFGDPVLKTKAAPVADVDGRAIRLVDEMFKSLYTCGGGVGLAAPQIGIAKRVSVIDTSVGEDESKKVVIINPEILSKEGSQTGEEGCLSIPGFREPLTRANKVTVRAQNEKGEAIELDGEELLARAFQHEIDHLNGILFIAHLSALKRDIIRRKIKKLQKTGEWD